MIKKVEEFVYAIGLSVLVLAILCSGCNEEQRDRTSQALISVEPNGVVDFDSNFEFVDNYIFSADDAQRYVDSGYVTLFQEDYYHHATDEFLSLVKECDTDVIVIIGGKTYNCLGLDHGHVIGDLNSVFTDNGENVTCSGTVEIITCDGFDGDRWIVRLSKKY